MRADPLRHRRRQLARRRASWFFGEIEDAQARLEPFIDKRHLAEMDALAAAAGVHPQEARLANFFPELFHCSGFAIFGKATKDGRMYHGRVLDYMKGVGLEQNAVVIVHQPDYGARVGQPELRRVRRLRHRDEREAASRSARWAAAATASGTASRWPS